MPNSQKFEEMVFCTSCCSNYLGKSLALASSIKYWMPKSKFIVALVERDLPMGFDIASYPNVDHFIFAKDLIDAESLDSWIFQYSIVEASTAIKGELLRYIYNFFQDSNYFVYLDPDTYVYSAFDELFDIANEAPIIVSPHLENPGNLEMELSSLKHGVFNLGFLAISRHEEAERFLDWWVRRLDFACYDDIPNGVFTDQKWINLVPCFFSCNILRHPGYNFATWSLMDRKLAVTGSNSFTVNDKPLRFAHFSGFDSGVFHSCIERWAPDNRETLLNLADDYTKACDAQNAVVFKRILWSYGHYLSGKPISRLARVAWRERRRMQSGVNPYGLGNFSILLNALRQKKTIVKILKELIKRYA